MTCSEILNELRSTRPVAPAALRTRVRAIATGDASPARTPRWLPGLFSTRRLLWVALPATAVLAVAFAGVAGLLRGGANDVAATAPTTIAEESAAKAADGATAAVPRAGAGSALEQTAPVPDAGRAQRVSATLSVEVSDTDALSNATQDALDITRSLGGYVVSASYATAEDGTSSLVLRVPAENVQDAITRLSSLGTIVGQQVQIDDLQEQIDALGRQVATIRTRIARLTAQLADPTLSKERRAVLTAQRATVRDQLAALTATRTARESEAQLATVQLTLVTERNAAVPPVPSRIDAALDEAAHVLAWEAAALVYALVAAGPLVLLVVVGWLAHRALQRRADERLLGAS